MKKQSGLKAAVSAIVASTSGLAWAQPAAIAQPADEYSAEVTGEILITAQKRSESAQRVPAAVTVASGERLVLLGVQNVAGLATVAPSAKFTSLRQQTLVYLRGVGQALTSSNADPAVATNFNGAYLPAETTGAAFFDIERVEVLPGPQGTLYGRNAAGGVINVITRRPGDRLAAEMFLEVGNYDRVQAFAAADVPISDTLALRAAGNIVRHDGYFNNGGDDRNAAAGRLTALWSPGDRTTVTLVGSYGHEGGIGAQTQNNPILGDPRELPFDPRELGFYNDFSTYIASGEVNHELTDDLSLTYIGGYSKVDGGQDDELFLGPPMGMVEVILRTRSTTHEARLNGRLGNAEFVAGAYFYDARADYATDLRIGPRRSTQSFVQHSKGQAAFGQLSYSLVPAWRVTAGLRYSHDEKRIDGRNGAFNAGVQLSDAPFEGDIAFNRLDWRAGLEWDVGARSLAYASVASGFNQGGFSTTTATPASTEAATYEPVDLIAYTAGVKNRFLDGDLLLNLEAFYYDYRDYQVAARNLSTGQNQVFNAEKARVYGAELDSRLGLSPATDLSLSIAYLNAKAIDLLTPVGRFDGNRLPYSPRWTINTSLRHEFDLAGGAILEALVNFQYVASQYGVYTNAPGTFLEDKTKTDASLTYRPENRNWSVTLWGRNLADTTAFALVNGGAIPGPGSGFLEPPRTYGIRLAAEF